MEKNMIAGLFFIFVGLFSIFCAVMDYDWFIENYRASLFLKLFGRNGCRAFYVVLGALILGFGITQLF